MFARFARARAAMTVALLVALAACAQPLPDDGARTTLAHRADMRGRQYAEFFLIGGNPLTRDLKAAVYNTGGLNGETDANRNSAPTAAVAAVDLAQVKSHYDVLGVYLNGPKLWMLDWVDVPVGATRRFGDLQARWVAQIDLKGLNTAKPGPDPYQPRSVARATRMGYTKGSTIFVIDDAQGNAWVMKGMNLGLKPVQSYAEAPDLGRRLKLPPGYRFRAVVLPAELVLIPADGIARIMPDDLDNVYDLAGPGYSNFKP